MAYEDRIRRLRAIFNDCSELDQRQQAIIDAQQAEIDRVNAMVAEIKSTIKWMPLTFFNLLASVLLCAALWPLACVAWAVMEHAGLSIVLYAYGIVTLPLAALEAHRFLSWTVACIRARKIKMA